MAVLDALKGKHPEGKSVSKNALLSGDNKAVVHPVIFDKINAYLIRSTVVCIVGSAGMDAKSWRICKFHKRESDDLCHVFTLMAKQLTTCFVDPDGLAPSLTSHLSGTGQNAGSAPYWSLRDFLPNHFQSHLGRDR